MKTIITYSEITAIRECRLMHHLKYERKLRPKVKSSKLGVGSIGHEAIRGFYLTKSDEWAMDLFTKFIDEEYNKIKGINVDAAEKFATEAVAAKVGFEFYLNDCGQKDLKQFEFVETEVQFKLPVINPYTREEVPDAFFAGKIDAIVKTNPSKSLGVMEHKFLRSFDVNVNLLSLDLQITSYMYAVARMTGEFPKFAHYNVLLKPIIKRKVDEGLTDYEDRVRLHIKQKLKKGQKPPYVYPKPKVTRNKDDYAVFEKELFHAVEEKRNKDAYKWRCINTNPSGHCSWKCSFKDICMTPDDSILVNQMFNSEAHEHPELEE